MIVIFLRNMAVTSFLVFSGVAVVIPSLITFINSALLGSMISGLLMTGHSLQQALAVLLPHGAFELATIVYASIESTYTGFQCSVASI